MKQTIQAGCGVIGSKWVMGPDNGRRAAVHSGVLAVGSTLKFVHHAWPMHSHPLPGRPAQDGGLRCHQSAMWRVDSVFENKIRERYTTYILRVRYEDLTPCKRDKFGEQLTKPCHSELDGLGVPVVPKK